MLSTLPHENHAELVMNAYSRIGMITGCGRGIGLACLTKVLSARDNSLIIGITRSNTPYLDELKVKHPDRLKVYIEDIVRFETINQILSDIQAQFGSIDFAICNAGVRSRKSIELCDLTIYSSILEVNTLAQINIVRQLVKAKSLSSYGLNILMISSIVGSHGFRDLSSYAVSKSALEGFVKSAAVELGADGVQINCLAPGFVESSYASNFKDQNEELYKWTLAQTPMGRWGTCEEIAELAAFLVSKQNSYMTGSVIYCDGGWTSK